MRSTLANLWDPVKGIEILDFPAMRSSLANLWHPVKGIEILDIMEKRFLFRFFHRMDLERVIREAPWTFNNHLLIFHVLSKGRIR